MFMIFFFFCYLNGWVDSWDMAMDACFEKVITQEHIHHVKLKNLYMVRGREQVSCEAGDEHLAWWGISQGLENKNRIGGSSRTIGDL